MTRPGRPIDRSLTPWLAASCTQNTVHNALDTIYRTLTYDFPLCTTAVYPTVVCPTVFFVVDVRTYVFFVASFVFQAVTMRIVEQYIREGSPDQVRLLLWGLSSLLVVVG